MPSTEFPRDQEFHKLVLRGREVDLTLAALEIARDAQPNLDFSPSLAWLDEQAAACRGMVARTGPDAAALRQLCEHLGGQCGLRGDVACFSSADSSYLSDVIRTRRGLPITLSLIYMAVAERLGMPITGVATQGHFICRFGGPSSPLFIDPYSGGTIHSKQDCLLLLSERTGIAVKELRPHLKTATPRTIIIRLLANLKSLFRKQEAWNEWLPVQRRLNALLPASYIERRDLGVATLKAGQTAEAINLLRRCASAGPPRERPLLNSLLREAESRHASWN